MKSLITTITTLVLFTQTAMAMKCKFYGQNATRDPITRSIITDESLTRAENSLLQYYPIGKLISQVPTRYRDIVYNNQDVSMTAIDAQAEKSARYWGGKISAQDAQYYLNHNFDWTAFQNLNQEAHAIWTEMKKCNQSNPQDLRKNYFTITICPNPTEGKALLSRLQNLTMNHFQFIDSSPLIMKNTTPMPRLLEVPDFVLPAQHPLLYQVSLQIWSLLLNLANEEPRGDGFISHMALDEYYGELTKRDVLGRYGNGIKNWAKLQYNLTLTLAGQDADCAALGLWPAMNRALIFVDDFAHNVSATIGEPIKKAGKKFEKACGLPVRASRSLPKTYNGYAIAHIFETRRLFLSYFSDLKKESKTMINFLRKSTKPTPYNELLCE